MRWLKAVIARLRPTRSPATATPTPSAGHVPPEPMPSTGSKPTALATSRQPQSSRPRLPARPAPRASQEPVLPIPQGLLSASAKAPALTPTDSLSGDLGKPKAPAPQTRPPAKSAQRPKQKPAKRGSSGKKTSAAKAPVPTPTASPSGVNGT